MGFGRGRERGEREREKREGGERQEVNSPSPSTRPYTRLCWGGLSSARLCLLDLRWYLQYKSEPLQKHFYAEASAESTLAFHETSLSHTHFYTQSPSLAHSLSRSLPLPHSHTRTLSHTSPPLPTHSLRRRCTMVRTMFSFTARVLAGFTARGAPRAGSLSPGIKLPDQATRSGCQIRSLLLPCR